MSSVAFGALATRREQSGSGTSTSGQPPGLGTYVDVLAALVPAEVLAINAIVITLATRAVPGGGTQQTDPATLHLAFWVLVGLSMLLYILGRRPSRRTQAGQSGKVVTITRWEAQDLIRVLIPPAAFTGWAMLDPASAWNAVVPGMSSGTRILIGVAGATALAAITKALATHSDLKAPPRETSAPAGASASQGAGDLGAASPDSGGLDAGSPDSGEQDPGTWQPLPAIPATAPPDAVPGQALSTDAPPPAAAISAGPPWIEGS